MFGFLPYLSSTPRGGLGTFWRRICTAPSAFRPPRLLCGRAASYGSIIVWKYQEAAYSPFKVHRLRACPPLLGETLAVTLVYLKVLRIFRKWYFRFWGFSNLKQEKPEVPLPVFLSLSKNPCQIAGQNGSSGIKEKNSEWRRSFPTPYR